jgi:hypothetical protein
MNRKTPKISIHKYMELQKRHDASIKELTEMKKKFNAVHNFYITLCVEFGRLPYKGKFPFW